MFRATPTDVRKRLCLSAIGVRLVFEAAPHFSKSRRSRRRTSGGTAANKTFCCFLPFIRIEADNRFVCVVFFDNIVNFSLPAANKL